jgi:hypothetical protein
MIPLVLLLALLVTACTNVESLKPGVARGTYESGFMKTTEGLSLTVQNRSYDQVWAAAEAAMKTAAAASAGVYSGRLKVVERLKDKGVIKSEEENFHGLTRAYVGVFISPATPRASAYVVEVSKILKSRTEVIQGRDWEVELLRAIQAEVGGR